MRKILILLSLVVFGAGCEPKEFPVVNKFLNDIEGTWQLSSVEEIRFSETSPPAEKTSFPKMLKATFRDCGYKTSGNNCYASIQINNNPAFEIKYHMDQRGSAIGFEDLENLNLTKEDSLFFPGRCEWIAKSVEAKKLVFEQLSKKPYYRAVMTR